MGVPQQGRGKEDGTILSSLRDWRPGVAINPPLETVGYYRSSLWDFSDGDNLGHCRDGEIVRARLRPRPPSRMRDYGGWTAPSLKLRNIQNRIFGFERKCFKVNMIGKREERKQTAYPRISGADGRTPLPGAGGVKAPEVWRSPRPGGLRGGPEHGEQRWELRQRGCEEDRAVVRMRWMPESGCSFVPQDIGGETVTQRGCPEFGGVAVMESPGVATVGASRGTVTAWDEDSTSWEASSFLKPVPHGGIRPATTPRVGEKSAKNRCGLALALTCDLDPFARPEIGTKGTPVVSRKPAVKAPEGWRSPRLGGVRDGDASPMGGSDSGRRRPARRSRAEKRVAL